MGCFTVTRAITVRVLFTTHGVFSIWRLYAITEDPQNWYLLLALFGLAFETAFTLYMKRGEDWKWFCPSVFFYLSCLVPTIWFLELHELNERIRKHMLNTTQLSGLMTTMSFDQMTTIESEYELKPVPKGGDDDDDDSDLSDKLEDIIGTSGFDSHQWVRTLEQLLLLMLILGRWMLPKGKLTHDQLSQLLLVYIGTAADIVEFFEAFNEEQVKYNRTLCMVILSIWSWSVLQFTLVFTATKSRKENPAGGVEAPAENCCTPDVFSIIMSIFMQDGPFLVLRMLLIFKYNVLSYTNMFFTCKNTLVCMLLTYRLIVIQIERYKELKEYNEKFDSTGGKKESGKRRGYGSNNADQYNKYSTKGALKELLQRATNTGKKGDESEKLITYVIKRHLSHASSLGEDPHNNHHNQISWSRSEFSFNSNDDIITLRGGEFSIGMSDLEMLPIASYEVGPTTNTINHHHRRHRPNNGNSNTSCSDSDRIDSSAVVDLNGIDEELLTKIENQTLNAKNENGIQQPEETTLNRQIDDVVRLIFGDAKPDSTKTNDSDSDSSLSVILRIKPPPQIVIGSPPEASNHTTMPYDEESSILLSPYYDTVAASPPPLPTRNSTTFLKVNSTTSLKTISERVDNNNLREAASTNNKIAATSGDFLSAEPIAYTNKSGLFGKKLFSPTTASKTKSGEIVKTPHKFSFKSKPKLLKL